MLDLMGFKKEFISQCRNALCDAGAEGMRIEEREVNKSQRGMLNGMLFIKEGANCAPTLYVEDFYGEYKRGAGIDALSHYAVDTVVRSMDMADMLANETQKVFKDKGNLGVRLINKRRNRQYLKGKPVKNVEGGLVFIAEFESGEYRAVVTDELLKSLEMSSDELFEKALANTIDRYPPLLYDLHDSIFEGSENCVNLLETPSKRAPAGTGPGYVLTNSRLYWGAGTLFYPGVIDRIHELLDDDFYVMPSSIHELIVLAAYGQDPEQLVETIRFGNESITQDDDILSNDLYICESGRFRRVSYGGKITENGDPVS